MSKIFFLVLMLTETLNAMVNPIIFNQDAIYLADNRKFVTMRSSPHIYELSKSIAFIVAKDETKKNFFYTQIIASILNDKEGLNLCPEEKFSEHHGIKSCTGFLIGDDLVASAGHCFKTADDCRRNLIIFNVLKSNENKDGYKVLNQNIFECKEIINHQPMQESEGEFAIIRLKTKPLKISPLKMRSFDQIKADDQVFMIGHPLGLPLMLSNTAQVTDASHESFFKAKLNSFEGNSGSPVFNSKTLEVEGILVGGEDDFYRDEINQCNRYKVYDENINDQLFLIKGEVVTRIHQLFPFINQF